MGESNLYYWREGKYEVDYVPGLGGKVYAIEVKSSRRRNINGLTKFLTQYPDSIPVIIDNKNIETLLQEIEVAGLFRKGEIL